MNKLEKLENITITYSKCLVLFLMCFIPFRNELELLLGTYIKVLPDMMILILLMGYVISQRGRVKIQLSDIIFCLFFLVALINTIFIKMTDCKIRVYYMYKTHQTEKPVFFWIRTNYQMMVRQHSPASLFPTMVNIQLIPFRVVVRTGPRSM